MTTLFHYTTSESVTEADSLGFTNSTWYDELRSSYVTADLGQDVIDPAKITTDDVLKIIYLIIGAVGLAGNALVIAVIVNHRTMLTAFTNVYILNQSVIDGTASVILLTTTLLEDSGRYLQGAADNAFCKLWLTNMPLWGLLVSSSYNLVAMTLERYLAVVYPIWHKVKMTRTKVVVTLAVAWMVGPFYQGAFKIATTEIVDGKCLIFQIWPNQLTRQAVGVLTVIVQYFIPLMLLVAFYAKMALVVHRRVHPIDDVTEMQRGEPEPGHNGGGAGRSRITEHPVKHMARARRNVIKTLALVSLAYVLCWTCSQMYFFIFNLGKNLSLSSPFYHFTVIAVYANSCLNPMIYTAKYQQFQRGLRKLVFRITGARLGRKPIVPQPGETGVSTVRKTLRSI